MSSYCGTGHLCQQPDKGINSNFIPAPENDFMAHGSVRDF
jgi:hypothetical protein